jgi:hypothetical protein
MEWVGYVEHDRPETETASEHDERLALSNDE